MILAVHRKDPLIAAYEILILLDTIVFRIGITGFPIISLGNTPKLTILLLCFMCHSIILDDTYDSLTRDINLAVSLMLLKPVGTCIPYSENLY